MDSLVNNCCVCLNNLWPSNKLSEKDENKISLLNKLRSSVPEIVSMLFKF